MNKNIQGNYANGFQVLACITKYNNESSVVKY